MDYRENAFKTKFESAARHLGVRPQQIVSFKLRESVVSHGDYQDFLETLANEIGLRACPAAGEFQGQAHVLGDEKTRVIIVEHETGLEILSIVGSVASILGLIPLVIQGWNAIRGRLHHRYPDDIGPVEIRRLDEDGHLREDHPHRCLGASMGPLGTMSATLSAAAATLDDEIKRLAEKIQELTSRVEAIEASRTTERVMRSEASRTTGKPASRKKPAKSTPRKKEAKKSQ
jgi:hypothetical protein